MKKSLLSLSTAIMLTTSAYGLDGLYFGGGLAVQDVADDNGVGLVLNGGAPLPVEAGDGTLGVEGELTFAAAGDTSDADAITLGAYATYTYNFIDNAYLKSKFGIAFYDSDYDDGVKLSAGVGGGYSFTEDFSAYVEYTSISALNNLTFGVKYQIPGL